MSLGVDEDLVSEGPYAAQATLTKYLNEGASYGAMFQPIAGRAHLLCCEGPGYGWLIRLHGLHLIPEGGGNQGLLAGRPQGCVPHWLLPGRRMRYLILVLILVAQLRLPNHINEYQYMYTCHIILILVAQLHLPSHIN